MTAPVNRRDSHRAAAQPGDMSITQQHLLDSYRAQRLGETPPPPPGTHDWRTAREPRGYRRFRAVVASWRAAVSSFSRITKSATAAFTSSAVHSRAAART